MRMRIMTRIKVMMMMMMMTTVMIMVMMMMMLMMLMMLMMMMMMMMMMALWRVIFWAILLYLLVAVLRHRPSQTLQAIPLQQQRLLHLALAGRPEQSRAVAADWKGR